MFEIPTSGTLISGVYNGPLVFLSYVISSFASFTALNLAGRLKEDVESTGRMWMVGCALSMGCGIWSMHFTAMLAFKLPIAVSYEFNLTAFSLVLAVVASGYGLLISSTLPISPKKIVLGGVVMGTGVAGMHYLGMSAMEMNASMHYSPGLFMLSIFIGIGASTAGLWLVAYDYEVLKKTNSNQVVSALIMGLAIFGMHFSGMKATSFVVQGKGLENVMAGAGSEVLAMGISGITFLILMVAVFASITQEELNKMRVIKGKAESANKAKSEFLSRMSHELRTPLNAILGFSQLMEMDSETNEKQKAYLKQILDSGHHLLTLINDVLDLAKIEAGEFKVLMEPIAVPSLAKDLMSLTQPMATEYGIRIENNIPESSPMVAMGDVVRAKQVILNLITNAIKYNNERGSVILTCEGNGDAFVNFVVSDTGPGIAGEKISKIFSPFERLDADDSKIEGSGIGLTICKDLAQKMGGDIHVESQLGIGSQFKLSLPRHDSEIPPHGSTA